MNIFYLDSDYKLAAQMQCDKHVVKMTLETAQLLCGAVWLNPVQLGSLEVEPPYKLTHRHHPCIKWATKVHNYCWLYNHFIALLCEYGHRYGRFHKCWDVLSSLPRVGNHAYHTQPPQCMPDQYKCNDTVTAYRAYYMAEKAHLAKWNKGRDAPEWFIL